MTPEVVVWQHRGARQQLTGRRFTACTPAAGPSKEQWQIDGTQYLGGDFGVPRQTRAGGFGGRVCERDDGALLAEVPDHGCPAHSRRRQDMLHLREAASSNTACEYQVAFTPVKAQGLLQPAPDIQPTNQVNREYPGRPSTLHHLCHSLVLGTAPNAPPPPRTHCAHVTMLKPLQYDAGLPSKMLHLLTWWSGWSATLSVKGSLMPPPPERYQRDQGTVPGVEGAVGLGSGTDLGVPGNGGDVRHRLRRRPGRVHLPPPTQ